MKIIYLLFQSNFPEAYALKASPTLHILQTVPVLSLIKFQVKSAMAYQFSYAKIICNP